MFRRLNGKMTTIPKRADEELWYLRIVKNFALPWDEDLAAQPPTGAGTPRLFDSWCDYIVVSDTLEGLAPVALRKPMAEPRDPADIPASNPDDPIDLESSPEPLLRTKTTKRKQIEVEAAGQPVKKVSRTKIGKRGNVDAFITKPPPLEGTKAAETEVEKVENPDVEKPIEVELQTEKVVESKDEDVNVTQPKSPEVAVHEPEIGKSVHEDPVITIPTSATTFAPVNVVRSPSGDQGFFVHEEEDSHIRPKETPGDYYYSLTQRGKPQRYIRRCGNLRKATLFQTGRCAVIGYKKKASEEEAWVALLRAKLEADQDKLESDQKTK
ncbi:hypothetical protein Hanom_Chr15g01403481 [Helianthus anomalus]